MRQQRQSGSVTSVEKYRAQGWTECRCDACHGSGMRPGSNTPYQCAMNECPACAGRGATWISPAGRRAAYPGGPWMGR